jgi:carboxymethylenebutenolidase
MQTSIDITTPDGSFSAHVTRPARRNAPAIIILQEIFGVNEGIRSIAERMAHQGFIAICPDLFWRSERNLSMSERSEADQEHGFALYRAYDFERGVGDIVATISAARQLSYCTGDVGVMGYCLGGLLSFLTAATGKADAVAAYYGGGTERFLEHAARIHSPLLMHLAGADEYIGPDAQQAIYAALQERPGVTLHTYAGQQHAFARPEGVHFDRDAADLANQRTLDFMRHHLG